MSSRNRNKGARKQARLIRENPTLAQVVTSSDVPNFALAARLVAQGYSVDDARLMLTHILEAEAAK